MIQPTISELEKEEAQPENQIQSTSEITPKIEVQPHTNAIGTHMAFGINNRQQKCWNYGKQLIPHITRGDQKIVPCNSDVVAYRCVLTTTRRFRLNDAMVMSDHFTQHVVQIDTSDHRKHTHDSTRKRCPTIPKGWHPTRNDRRNNSLYTHGFVNTKSTHWRDVRKPTKQ